MYQVITVDDELVIRSGITNFINSEIEDFRVLHSFSDGSEAIEFINTNDVDLVISDIKMNRVSGIELAKYIYENKPYIKVILLSGYREFEYARSAIQYGVKNYILKPTNFAEFKEVLSQMKLEMDQDRTKKDQVQFMDKIKLLYSNILSGKRKEAADTLLSVFEDVKENSPANIGQYVYDLYEIIIDKLNLYLKLQLSADKFNLKQLLSQHSVQELKNTALDILERISGMLLNEEEASNEFLLQDIKEYMNEHLQEDISLQDVADKMFFSTVYFSRFFKKQTGETFSNYLLRIRMEQAVKLLEKNLKVTEISEACGYHDPSYFTRIFKEYYKYTPKDYARRFMSCK
ncbi:response regulator [Anaerocolumna sp. AGMB13020]|uniref:response regulator transcription factor n=1 Tax=Anaerocolumna sp. AGMB13020 TaxID=3081750 RepID=UPI0029554420|nr:response regulator [Anaerocolumna sp. AGMB13020]WOO37732.1 response regulator [Anaerocolumna sp. AGMB13020]